MGVTAPAERLHRSARGSAADGTASGPRIAGVRGAPPPGDLRVRAVSAALTCIGRTGLAKLTVEDVARECGASRATLYRAFPSKQALVAAAVGSEADRIVAVLADAVATAGGLDDAVTRIIVVGTGELRASRALVFVATHERELLAPHLEFAGGDRLYAELRRRLGPLLAPWCADPLRAAEWVARCGLCLLWSSSPPAYPGDARAVGRFVAAFVTPGIARRAAGSHDAPNGSPAPIPREKAS